MSKESALAKYAKAVEKRDRHIEANKSVFKEHESIVYDVIDAENELRDAVAESGSGVSDIDYTVTLTPQTQTWADIETIDKYVANGEIAQKVRDEIVKTQKRPAKISIKRN